MTIGRWKHGPLALCLGVSCWWPATALAQDCSDRTKLLSERWFLTKADCGADKLVDAGVKVLSNAGIDLARTALSQYLPGLSELLFGNSDPFADDFAALKLDMEAQADRIIDEMLAQRTRTSTIELLGAMDDMRDFSDDPMFIRATNLGRIAGVDDVLNNLMIDLMWPLAANWSTGVSFNFNFDQMAPEDLDRFHALMQTSGMRAEAFPMSASAEYYAGIVNDYDQPTPGELDSVEAQSHGESLSDLSDLLSDLQLYLNAVSSKNLFRLRSDQRFTQLFSGNACGNFAYTYSKAAIGQDPLAAGSDRYQFYYTDDGLRGTPPSCFGTFAGTGSYRIVQPDGTETTGRTNQSSFVAAIQLGYENNRLLSYQSFLLGAYGAARPAMSRWYRQVNQVAPVLAIDQDLRTALRARANGALVLDALSNTANAALSATDSRAAEDMILESNTGLLYGFELAAAGGADFLHGSGPHPISVVRRFLYGQAGTRVFSEQGAAKFTAINQYYQ